jgi:transcriptional regulator with XRE-family HTH domain
MNGMKKTIYDNDYKIFVRRLKKAREDTGLTQVQVAKKLGSTQAYISKVESGQLRVDVAQLKEFAKIYRKDIQYFVK